MVEPRALLETPPTWWYEQHRHLPKTVSFYLWHGLATSTRKTYSTGQCQFIQFTQLHSLYNSNGSILLASQPASLSWVASLWGRVQPKTIKSYLTAVRSLHTDAGLPFDAIDSPLVQRLIHGFQCYHGEKERRPVQPVTLPILTALLAQLWPGVTPGHTIIYAACCLAYSGLLHSGEFTTGKGGKFNPSLNLSRDCVPFLPDFTNATHVHVTLPASKTDPFRRGVTITVAAAPGHPTCPVATLKAMFTEIPQDHNAPLFKQPDGKPLSYSYFVKGICEVLTLTGLNPDVFAGHSFCRGAASEAAAAGYSDYGIQLLGRWRSDAYRLYVENDTNCILQLSFLLHLAHTQVTPFEPPALRGFTAWA